MKILYVCHRFPFPPKRGGKIRPFNMIRHFSEQGHQVYVASLARNQAEAAENIVTIIMRQWLRSRCSSPG